MRGAQRGGTFGEAENKYRPKIELRKKREKEIVINTKSETKVCKCTMKSLQIANGSCTEGWMRRGRFRTTERKYLCHVST
jgi:hypothetical protein